MPEPDWSWIEKINQDAAESVFEVISEVVNAMDLHQDPIDIGAYPPGPIGVGNEEFAIAKRGKVTGALQKVGVFASQGYFRNGGPYGDGREGYRIAADEAVVREAHRRLDERLHPRAGRRAGGAVSSDRSRVVFVGHGRSPLWRELQTFLRDRLKLEVEEFNTESAAGVPTTVRLEEMISKSGFAFLLMTAEDVHEDGTRHARENVIHEAGLFQGALGFRKAIVLLEEGCEEFSNIHGLGQIRFPRGHFGAKFEEIRQVLERERVIGAA